MNTVANKLLESGDRGTLIALLRTVQDKVLLVGSRGRGRHRQDSDIDLHVVDMMETDETFDAVIDFLDRSGVEYFSDKWGTGSIQIREQPGFPVPVEFGFWTGIPGGCEMLSVDVFGVVLQAPQA